MGSGDYITSQAAQRAFADFVSQPILQVIEQAPVLSDLFGGTSFENWTITGVKAPDIPLDIAWGSSDVGIVRREKPTPPLEVAHPVHNTWCHGAGRPRLPS